MGDKGSLSCSGGIWKSQYLAASSASFDCMGEQQERRDGERLKVMKWRTQNREEAGGDRCVCVLGKHVIQIYDR